MTTRQLPFNAEGLDVWSEEVTTTVTREALAAYASATNDPIEAHRGGDIAPPVFAIVPVFESLMEPTLDVVPLEVLGLAVHGKQDFRFHRPIRPGDELKARGTMKGFVNHPRGTRCHVVLECTDADDLPVVTQHVTFVIRGVDAGKTVGDPAPDYSFPEALRSQQAIAEVSAKIDEDQTFRYSEASGDPMPIHLDEDVAKDAGLPGIIAHGLCTMAFTSWAVLTQVGGSDVTRLQRLAVRFAKPVLPGQELTTRIWRGETADGSTTYHYETTVGETVVIGDGLAVLSEGS